MQTQGHARTLLGRAFLWGGIAFGGLLVAVLYTKGFGLFGEKNVTEETPIAVHQGDRIEVPEGSPLRDRLSIAAAPAEAVNGKLTLPGIVESDPARTLSLLTPLAGRVLELKVSLGDRVTQGQTLAVIDSPDLAQAYDDDEKAADQIELTKKNLERQEGQIKLGASSARDLDQAKSDYAQAASEYTRTQARLRVIGVDGTSHGRARTLAIKAPVSGSITSLSVAAGNVINDPTQPMMTLADLAVVWVTALAPEKDLAAVAPGQQAEVVLDAYPGRTLRGKVQFVSDVIEPDSRRNKLRIAFPNPDRALKPNMFATVTLLGPQQTRVVLPTSALLMNNDRTTVFVATAPWTFERRVVEPQLEEGSTVAIRSGVEPGEQVVVKGGILLND